MVVAVCQQSIKEKMKIEKEGKASMELRWLLGFCLHTLALKEKRQTSFCGISCHLLMAPFLWYVPSVEGSSNFFRLPLPFVLLHCHTSLTVKWPTSRAGKPGTWHLCVATDMNISYSHLGVWSACLTVEGKTSDWLISCSSKDQLTWIDKTPVTLA